MSVSEESNFAGTTVATARCRSYDKVISRNITLKANKQLQKKCNAEIKHPNIFRQLKRTRSLGGTFLVPSCTKAAETPGTPRNFDLVLDNVVGMRAHPC